FQLQVALPESISQRDREGILRSIERCTVKKVIQQGPEFKIQVVDSLEKDSGLIGMIESQAGATTMIPGKDLPLEETIKEMTGILAELGIKIEIASWRNNVPNVWS